MKRPVWFAPKVHTWVPRPKGHYHARCSRWITATDSDFALPVEPRPPCASCEMLEEGTWSDWRRKS